MVPYLFIFGEVSVEATARKLFLRYLVLRTGFVLPAKKILLDNTQNKLRYAENQKVDYNFCTKNTNLGRSKIIN